MTRMNCKLKTPEGTDCGIPIDYNPDTKRATNLDGTDHFHPKKKGNWANKKAIPIESELELLARISGLEQQVAKHDEILRAHTQELDFKKGTEVSEQ